MDVSLRFGFRQNSPTVLSARLLLGLPTGKSEQAYGLVTGDGEFNQMLMLEAGHSFYPRPFYVIGEFGVNNRTNNFSDEFRYGAAFGENVLASPTFSLGVLWAQ